MADDLMRSVLIEKLEEYVDASPDANEPLYTVASDEDSDGSATPAALLRDVRERTPRGEKFVKDYVSLFVETTRNLRVR